MDRSTTVRTVAATLAVAAAFTLLAGALRSRRRAADHVACVCGARYRVTGEGRHRVFWPEGASEDEPVLGDACIACERPLVA